MATPPSRLIQAVADYRWLLDRGYPDHGSIKLVGDRHRLSGTERGVLYRGVFGRSDSDRRRARLVRPIEGGSLVVDGHNVLFTVRNYLAGRPVVTATDGFVRDIGGTRSRLPHDGRFDRLATLVCAALRSMPWREITVLLDEPLPWSREHAALIEETWRLQCAEHGGDPSALSARTEASVDATVARTVGGAVATSDTAIIDRCPAGVFDLGGHILRVVLSATLPDMSSCCD